jgi:hypothetical protein
VLLYLPIYPLQYIINTQTEGNVQECEKFCDDGLSYLHRGPQLHQKGMSHSCTQAV